MTSKKFIRATSGWIPVSVMLLFATALVSAQACDQVTIQTAQAGAEIVEPDPSTGRKQP